MKKIIAVFLLVSTFSFSQETIKVNLGDFNEIKTFNALKVTLKKAKVAAIEISGKKASEVVYKNVNGNLKISMRLAETFNANEVTIIVYYTDELTLIDANEGSIITSKDRYKLEKLELKAQEGALINLDVKVVNLKIRSVTGAVITLKGTVKHQDIEATTGGSYYGLYLESNTATAFAASGATVEVNVKERLNATVRFGGGIYYKEAPKELVKEKVLGGTIRLKD